MAPLTHHDRHQVYDHLIEQARFEAVVFAATPTFFSPATC
jgi:hypothetical protein